MLSITLPVAFTAGVISFFAPCVIPLIPSYVAYVSGISLNELKKNKFDTYAKKLIISSLFYILGFSLIFVALGTAAAGIGGALRQYSSPIQRVGGAVILIFGLQFSGILKLPFLSQSLRFKLPSWVESLGYLRSFFIGVVFAFAWSPCIGVVLGSILALAISAQSITKGALLLFVYSLGISFPFLIVSLTLVWIPKYLKFINKNIGVVAKISGLFLAFIGLLLVTDTYKYFSAWIFDIAFKLGEAVR